MTDPDLGSTPAALATWRKKGMRIELDFSRCGGANQKTSKGSGKSKKAQGAANEII
ncbi:hypothetical protein [Ruegeria arenilitoris]|uniref:hypothetical protein n=1 Tax=Ruegeria arenilitoris TaxID=1173585 RepID=UPI0020C469A1|nr:hypothetical protein [Ruegeria arenilitoris]